MSWDIGTYLDRAIADGAYVIHAHPFREGVEPIILYPSRTHCVEVLSAARSAAANHRAEQYAVSYGLPRCAGSDCHSTAVPRLCGVATGRKLANIDELIAALSSENCEFFDNNL